MKSESSSDFAPDVRKGVRQRAAQILVALLLQAAILCLTSGEFGWLWGWLYVATYVAGIAVNSVFMLRRPEQVAERGRAGFQKNWDKVVSLAWGLLFFFILLVVAGLDERLGWSPDLSLGLQLVGLAGFALGLALFSWAMIVNAYFSTVVRLQSDRGHTVCGSGPYRVVRHPGYAGAILQGLAAPLLLGSLWALVPGTVAGALMVLRTVLEDRTLQKELPGYEDYVRRVRFRLLPGVW
ncbi:MAG: isoprenylcysteine carboxylmethyltransferase family protein [Chloroflexi bacterium]|nr:isoprenylcysteine carboxylmethyltransferase family protein [Chloroflexota bacterium]